MDDNGNTPSHRPAELVGITDRERLERERDPYFNFFLLSTDALCIANPFGCFKQVNPAFALLTGYSEGELLSKPFLDFVHPDDRQRTAEEMELQVAVRSSLNFENRYVCKDGSVIHLAWRAHFDKAAGVTYASARDITESKRAEAALRDAHWRLESILEGTRVGTWEWNIQTGETVFNEEWARIIGYTLEELAPTSISTWETFTHPDDLRQSGELLEQHFAGELPYYDCECRMRHKDGHWIWVHDRGRVATRTADGKPLMMFGTHSDITERKLAEDALRQALRLLDETQAMAHHGGWEYDDATERISWTEEVYRIYGVGHDYDPSDVTRDIGFYSPGHASIIQEAFRRAVELGEPYDLELEFTRASGERIWVRTFGRPAIEDGHVVRVTGGIGDITERKLAEEEVHRLALIAETAPNAITVHGFDGRFFFTNQRNVDLHGYSQDEFMALTLADLDVPADQSLIAARMQELRDHGEGAFEVAHFRKDGTTFPLEVRAKVTTWGGNAAILSIATDITARKKAEDALRTSRKGLQQAQRLAHIGSWHWTVATDTVTWSEELYHINGLNPELPAPSFTEMSACYTPESWTRLGDAVTRTLETGEPYELELDIVRLDGTERHTSTHGDVDHDASGTIVSLHGTVQDITEHKQAEQALAASEALYRSILNASPDAVAITDTEARIQVYSPMAVTMFGFDADADLSGRLITDFIVPEDRTRAYANISRMRDRDLARHQRSPDEYRALRPDGTVFDVEVMGDFMHDAAGQPTGIIFDVRDITQRKQAEQALRESEVKFRTVADFTYDWEAWRGPDGAYRYVSPSCERISGHTPSEFMTNPNLVLQLTHPDDHPNVAAHFEAADRESKELESNLEFRILTPAGEFRWISHLCTAVYGEGGQWLGRRESNRDVTSRKLAEEALREREADLNEAQRVGAFGSWEWNATTDTISWSENYFRIYGFDPNQPPPAYEEHLHSYTTESAGRLRLAVDRAMQTGEPYELDLERATTGGPKMWVTARGEVMRDESGRIIGLRGTAQDVSARRQAEEAIRESEARFQLLFDGASDGIALLSLEGELLSLNHSFARMHGYIVEELLHRNMQELDTPEHARGLPVRMARLLAGEALTFELEHVHRDGHVFPIEVSASLISSGGTPVVQAFHRDITARRQAEDAIRESEARFRAVVETVPAAIRIYDGDRMVFANGANSALTGYSHEEILAPGWLERIVHPEDLAALRRLDERRIRSEPREMHYESRIIRKDGQVRQAVSDSVPIIFGGHPATLVTSTDITERKQAEEARRKLDLQVQDAQKLESLGVLAGGIAHDFNNLLTAVLGNIDLALMDIPPESPARESIEEIGVAARRAADLTAQMLAYSGKGHFFLEPLNFAQLVKEMAPLIDFAIPPESVVEYHLAPNTPFVRADSAQVRQVVMSILTNASEAIGDAGGFIEINTGVLSADRAYLSETYLDNDLPEGDYAFLEVADTGAGMDEETRLRIFEPFFTTKFTGRGLGLAAVLGIVRGHRGAIKVASEVGRGATFRVLFPVFEPAAAPAPARPNPTILVVDDDATVRTITSRILGHSGYTVITARDGKEAIALYEQQASFPDLVLLDMTMPGMDGRATFRELRRIDPTARIVLMSGFTEADAAEQFAGEDLTAFMHKPFLADDLLATLGNALA